jgi:hypothetical protein
MARKGLLKVAALFLVLSSVGLMTPEVSAAPTHAQKSVGEVIYFDSGSRYLAFTRSNGDSGSEYLSPTATVRFRRGIRASLDAIVPGAKIVRMRISRGYVVSLTLVTP